MEGAKKSDGVVTVDVYAAKDLLSTDHLYLDVRTEEEYNKGHVEGAINVPYMFITPEGKAKNPNFLSKIASICKKEDQLIVACYSGGRSLLACVDLLNGGYVNVRNMDGGYSKWVECGFAADQGKPAGELKTACK